MQKSLTEQLAADGATVLDQNLWNRLLRTIDTALTELQGIKISWEALTDDALSLALERINSAILPAAQQIRAISSLGFLTAGSSSTVTLAEGEIAQFILSDDGRPELFSPTKWVVISRLDNPNDIAIGTVSYFNRETLQFEVLIETALGSPGPFSDWEFSGQAGVVEAQRLLYEATQEAAGGVSIQAGDVAAKHGTVVDRYNSLVEIWHGPRTTPPPGAILGSAYVDTSQTPYAVKINTLSGWAPAVSTSIGGSRHQDYPAASGGETTLTVDGGYSVGDVFLNRQLRRAGVEVTLNPTAGTFTFASPLSAGDVVSFRGYLANDVTDIYTKAEANTLLAAKAPLASPAFTGVATIGGSAVWHAGNDGAGSGLDADTLDGVQLSNLRAFPRRADGVNLNFNGADVTGTPARVYGTSDGVNFYQYNPAGFSVNHAATAGSAGSAGTAGSAGYASNAGTVGGFTPPQQGGGSFQKNNKLYFGWDDVGVRVQVDSTDLGKIWTDIYAGESASANGWQRLPSGIIIQWGYVNVSYAGEAVAFPITFPAACRSITAMYYGSDNTVSILASAVSASGCTLKGSASPGGGTYPAYYMAIGY